MSIDPKLKYYNPNTQEWEQIAPTKKEFDNLAGEGRTTETVKGNKDQIDDLSQDIGNLNSLTTEEQSNLVGAINEIDGAIDTHRSDYAYHNNLIAFPGYYIITTFDDPTPGDITETMYDASDDSVYLTKLTEFDTPTAGDITTTLFCASLGINSKVVTEFDTPTAGDIKETASEVV